MDRQGSPQVQRPHSGIHCRPPPVGARFAGLSKPGGVLASGSIVVCASIQYSPSPTLIHFNLTTDSLRLLQGEGHFCLHGSFEIHCTGSAIYTLLFTQAWFGSFPPHYIVTYGIQTTDYQQPTIIASLRLLSSLTLREELCAADTILRMACTTYLARCTG